MLRTKSKAGTALASIRVAKAIRAVWQGFVAASRSVGGLGDPVQEHHGIALAGRQAVKGDLVQIREVLVDREHEVPTAAPIK